MALGSLFLAMSIPNERIVSNLLRSASLHDDGGTLFTTPLSRSPRDTRQPVTEPECAVLALGIGSNQSTAGGVWHSVVEMPTILACKDLRAYLAGQAVPSAIQYERYWHGYSIVTRPLLARFALSTVQLITSTCLAAFCILALLRFVRAAGPAMGLGLLAPLLFIGGGWTSTVAGAPVWLTACVGVFAVSAAHDRRAPPSTYIDFFVVLGAMTSFTDLLTLPLATFMLPGVALMALEGLRSQAGRGGQGLRLLASLTVAWCVGYFGFWALKFVVVFLDVGSAGVDRIVAAALLRLHGPVDQQAISVGAATLANFARIRTEGLLLAIALVTAAALHPAKGALVRSALQTPALLLFSLVPLVWYEVFANHSYVHASMTSLNAFTMALPFTLLLAATWREPGNSDSSG